MAMHRNLLGLSLLLTREALCFHPGDDLVQCVEEDSAAVTLLQVAASHTHTRKRARFSFSNKTEDFYGPAVSYDEHGVQCALCDNPNDNFPERCDRTYDIRHDCGNHSLFDHPEVKQLPLIEFYIPANDTFNGTNAFCELNLERVCADALVNRDFLMVPKSQRLPRTMTWDPVYCRLNGFLTPEFRALQHDFAGMKAATDELCNTKYLNYGWNSTLTMNDMEANTSASVEAGAPGLGEAEVSAAWRCAMGTLGCDVAYCVYSFCVKDGGEFGYYEECEGWDPVRGMPV